MAPVTTSYKLLLVPQRYSNTYTKWYRCVQTGRTTPQIQAEMLRAPCRGDCREDLAALQQRSRAGSAAPLLLLCRLPGSPHPTATVNAASGSGH
mmetsp:Transcript_13300/g.40254  ORF Transcript_13300/g.40254 Transcript_13300/m.40254 type:complete len:94 (+) Transcript_13300:378-659(+)